MKRSNHILCLAVGTSLACQPAPRAHVSGDTTGDAETESEPTDAPDGAAAPPGAPTIDADAGESATDPPDARYRVTFDDQTPQLGAAEPLVTIVEFSDFQCPYCTRLSATLRAVVKAHPEDVKVVFKQFPLPTHSRASAAAQAFLAANAQGKGWELHDEMFANQRALSDAQILSHAERVGVPDIERFRKELTDGTHGARVQADMKMGRVMAVRSTPSFFVNGRAFRGAMKPAQLEKIVQAELREARALVDGGTPRRDIYAAFMAAALEKRSAPRKTQRPKRRPGPNPRDSYAVPATGPSWGNASAPVTIVAFSDFQCPYCSRARGTLERIKATYGPDQVRIVFRNLPLSMHRDAPRAARAGFAAARQGKFWEMHDLMFDHPRALQQSDLERYAVQLGLDVGAFTTAMNSKAAHSAVATDLKATKTFGVTAAPAFFINGRFLSGAQKFEAFEKLIEVEREKAEAIRANWTGPDDGLYDHMRTRWRASVEPEVAGHR